MQVECFKAFLVNHRLISHENWLPEKQLLIKNINNNIPQEGRGNHRQCQNINVLLFFFLSHTGPYVLIPMLSVKLLMKLSVLSGSGDDQN